MSPVPASLLILALLLGGCSDSSAASALQEPAPPRPAGSEVADLRAQLEEAQARIVELEGELQAERAQRFAREEEWLRFTRGLSELSRAAGVKPPEFPTPLVGENPAPQASVEDPARAGRRAHGRELLAKLRALFFADEVAGLDLLEAGEFEQGALGPVVLRELDPDGRPYGTLCAERLRLEGSQAARTLTIVLEQGYERRGAQRFPFDEPGASVVETAADPAARRGTRRIELPEVDPARWIAKVPELFGPAAAAQPIDDGRHDRTVIRVALNLLLREDASAGWWRLSALGGVQGDVLREVVLDGFDRDGRMERKLFADRMTIQEQPTGVQLLLEQGAQVRGDQKLPFLEDRYRIFLPQADAQLWAKAGVPLVHSSPKRD
ncbi:MAG: hypothetical protein IPJ19_15110 [Planctomycetes bacterium]|nr:hypothetical protein [Planctomycetota bacterium]